MSHRTHIVAIGGGGGATQVLKAVQHQADRLTAIIAVTDTGRSTGLARAIGGIPAPGDLRATIAAFATDPLIADLLQYRFSGAGIAQLEGMAFGNLLIAAFAQVLGNFDAAVKQVAQLASCSADVLPVGTTNTDICAELADGTIVAGELHVRGLNKPPIQRVFLREPAAANSAALAAIRGADLLVIGPGSLFTSLLATLIFGGIADAVRDCRGTVVYICNTTTQPGQTDGYTARDHVARISEALGHGALDIALINRSECDDAELAHLANQGIFLLRPDDAEIAAIRALGVEPVVRDFSEPAGARRVLWNKQDTVRHDTTALGAVLQELLMR
jgi:uncharacterized cofD-like protein